MTSDTSASVRRTVDPRGPRFGAAITTVVLAVTLVFIDTTAGTVLIAWQTLVFALGSLVGLQAQPYGWVFRRVVRPRLSPPSEMEDAAPPRFAQTVGLIFLAVALVASLAGVTIVATIAIAMALVAAFLNAAFNLCLGCEMYLIGARLRRS
ncbi:MAG: DUF4395 domain-containing protein [Candidatus Nanopelagicales bacterium]|nr:DUF4395 domain-containing protein [Candidatus Nanopelagicales bacterium]MCF8536505.1 DUF4395 domain-containing protein [Candidatus Nanopelagicales bacterium]MCF8542289.1 DUF4395 domain-containing protein [Candidatus Nanopelagicales bacterium]MCF8556487.1 DUF4395 domain-containing protein [Candidatus Nanopelagicales bacterium]